ncbi:cytochrome P450 [Gymnopus androsaceus JB14]|uniref:Cytochrome P450 n=1 Tax=Gymnopus androsaceus JB14 TaxID=1447944 RepID=A0A6A4I032_9AGAR|nr:cytochrome P450 [Gymnopus androsaceus JB14]
MENISLTTVTVTSLFAAAFVIFLFRKSSTIRFSQLPPGPRQVAFIGNVLELSVRSPWVTFSAWAKAYGPVVYASFFGDPYIIISSADVASEFLDQNSVISSARPVLTMASLTGYDKLLPLLPPDRRFKATRACLQRGLNAESVARYSQDHQNNAIIFVHRLLKTPHPEVMSEIRRCVAIGIGRITYGTEISAVTSKYVELGEQALAVFGLVTNPNYWAVDMLPILRFLPSLLPGMSFKRQSDKWRTGIVKDIVDVPFHETMEEIKHGRHLECLVSQSICDSSRSAMDEEEYLDIVKWAACSSYLGGTETSVSFLSTFFLAMLLHPNIQKRAQDEIDAITGGIRLPEFSDRQALPFIDCIFKELLRWQPPAPLVFPHILEKEHTLRSMSLPRGSVVCVNAWEILQDEINYPDPKNFHPERFLDPEVPSSFGPSFGYGRRVCPGFQLANRSLWMIMSTTLALVDITCPIDDKTGEPKTVKVEYTEGPMRQPVPFDCVINMRKNINIDESSLQRLDNI